MYRMLISEILELPSVDSDAACFGGSDWDLAETLDRKNVSGAEYDLIRTEIENDGINRFPLHVDFGREMRMVYAGADIPPEMDDCPMFGNGHHRLKIMIELGLTEANVSDNVAETTDDGEWSDHDKDFLYEAVFDDNDALYGGRRF